jgi:hypothetical protein
MPNLISSSSTVQSSGIINSVHDSTTIAVVGPLRNLTMTISASLTFSDSETRIRVLNRASTGSMSMSESIADSRGKIRTVSQSLSISEAISKEVLARIRMISESLTLSSSHIRLTARQRTIAESLTLSSSVSRIKSLLRSTSHSISLTDSISSFRLLLQTISDSISFSGVTINRLKNKIGTVSDSLTFSNTVQRTTTRQRSISESMSMVDLISIYKVFNRILTDSLTFSESISEQRNKYRPLSDTFSLSSTHSRITTRLRLISQSLTLSDSISNIRSKLKSFSDTLTLTDTEVKTEGKTKTISDSLTFTDVETRFKTKLRAFTPTLTFVDSIIKKTTRLKSIAEFINLVASTVKLKNNGTPQPTRFYFHSAFCTIVGILPSTNQSAMAVDYNVDSISNSRTMDTTKSTTLQKSLSTSVSSSFFTTSDYYITRFISQPLGQFSISANTWKYSISAINAGFSGSDHAPTINNTNPGPLNINVYVWRPRTGAKVGTIRDGNTSNVVQYSDGSPKQRTAYATFAGAAVSGMEQTDVLVVECWMHIWNGTFGSQVPSFYFDGTTVNVTDGALVSNHAAFLETPEAFSFSILRNLSRDISTSIHFLAIGPTRLRGFVQVINDTVSLSDTRSQKRTKLRAFASNLTLSESISKHKPIVFKNISHTLSFVSDTVRFKTRNRSFSDSLLIISSLYRGLRTEKLKTIDHLLRLSDIVSKTQNNFKSFYIRILRLRGDK